MGFFKKIPIFCFSCSLCFAATVIAEVLDKVPTVVGESAFVLPATCQLEENWTVIGDANLAKADDMQGRPVLQIDYWLKKPGDKVVLDYKLPAERPVTERLRFWLKADGSNSKLQILCYHNADKKWIELTTVNLDSYNWQHLEIPASNPIYRYYKSITAFRFLIADKDDVYLYGRRKLSISQMELVSPEFVKEPLQNRPVPSPAFDTWGGPGEEQFMAVKNVGTTIHLAPIGFFGNKTVSQRIDYASKAVKWMKQAGLTCGIQFYNHPGEWIKEHPEMFAKNQDGQIQLDGGTFTSPWNPQAKELWRNHITDCLKQMKQNGSLEYVELVELCPGEECELCFHWDGVWAFDEYAIAAYKDYLKELYSNDISKLNNDWAGDYQSFEQILPPKGYFPDRSHWVFTDFYRLSMLRYCVFLADSVSKEFTPKYWLWMPHTLGSYPGRSYSARYPLFYAENLRRLGYIDYAQIAALDWQGVEDVQYLQSLAGLKVIGEIDVTPSAQRMQWTFEQCEKFGTDGVFIGTIENLVKDNQLNERGKMCQRLITDFKSK